MQCHLSGNMLERLHLEVRRSHPRIYRAERMLDGLASQRDLVGSIVKPLLDALEYRFVFPAADAALLARGTLVLDRTVPAGIRPAGFCVRKAVGQPRSGRTDIGVLPSDVGEVGLPQITMPGSKLKSGRVRPAFGLTGAERRADPTTRTSKKNWIGR